MRISFLVLYAFLPLAIASPALIIAQFQQPTAEELKLTSDTKAPGAAAVYLYHEEIFDNPGHTRAYYERIKVLTEKGKELASVNIPYEHGVDKVIDIEGRTILADGTVIPLTVKSSDLVDIKTKGFQMNSVIFTLPGVEVGSILEYRVKFRRDEDWDFLPIWQVQKPYFIHRAHYLFRSGSYVAVIYAEHLGSDAKVVKEKDRAFTLDMTDVPPEPSEDWMPPLNTLRWRVAFFSGNLSSSGEAFWSDTLRDWDTWIENFTSPTGVLKKAVAEIVAPGDTDEQKAIKIYTAVQKLDNTGFSRAKSEAERKKDKLKDITKAEDVWKQQSGSGNDIALLYAAMARTAGLKAWPAFIVNRDRAMFDKGYLSNSQFDDDIVMVDLGGKNVYLDPGQKMCPFGSMHWKHTLATGFQLAEKSAVFTVTPAGAYKDSTVQRIANLSIDETGSVKGTVRFVMNGPTALYWRQLALENDEDEVKKQFKESMITQLPDGVLADFDHFLALDNYTASLVGILNVSGNIGSVTGKHLFLPGLFFESRGKHPFVARDERTIPIDVHYPELVQDQVTYHLPPGFAIESSPQDANTSWPDFALLKIHSSAKDGSVIVSRTLAYNFTLLDPKGYHSLHDFYVKVATADQQQLVLTRTPVAKGN
jgi:hypothetical protein